MPFQEFVSPDLRLPINGKVYVVKDPPYEVGLRAQALMSLGERAVGGEDVTEEAKLSDAHEKDLYRDLLGDTLQELERDGLGGYTISRVGMTALLWVTLGLAAAERFWNEEQSGPKEPADEPASSDPPDSPESKPPTRPRKKATHGPKSSTTGT